MNYRLANGNFNFEKCALLGSQLREMFKRQQLECPYEQLQNVVTYLQKAEAFTDDLLMKASYECEPADSAHEKQNYKALKAAK